MRCAPSPSCWIASMEPTDLQKQCKAAPGWVSFAVPMATQRDAADIVEVRPSLPLHAAALSPLWCLPPSVHFFSLRAPPVHESSLLLFVGHFASTGNTLSRMVQSTHGDRAPSPRILESCIVSCNIHGRCADACRAKLQMLTRPPQRRRQRAWIRRRPLLKSSRESKSLRQRTPSSTLTRKMSSPGRCVAINLLVKS